MYTDSYYTLVRSPPPKTKLTPCVQHHTGPAMLLTEGIVYPTLAIACVAKYVERRVLPMCVCVCVCVYVYMYMYMYMYTYQYVYVYVYISRTHTHTHAHTHTHTHTRTRTNTHMLLTEGIFDTPHRVSFVCLYLNYVKGLGFKGLGFRVYLVSKVCQEPT